MTDAFCPYRIAASLNSEAGKIAVEIVEETGSTNTDLLLRVPALSLPTLLLARRQTAGRGRNGRPWHSGQDTSLTFSLAWPFSRPAAALGGLSLAVGVSLAHALRQLDVFVSLKWPNDILRDGKKLAGILIERPPESSQRTPGKNWVIIGIGLNLQLPEELEAKISQPAAESLWLSGMDKNRLMAVLLNHLTDSLLLFDREGLAAFTGDWNDLHGYAGKKITVFQEGRPGQTGTVAGIDHEGRLILEESGSRFVFSAGDVSLRPFDG